MTAITLDQTTAEAGKVFKINYSASDDVSDLREVLAYFRNDSGQTLSLRDDDSDGILSANISSTQQDGSYKLDYVRIYDDATNSNSITYYPDGKTAFYSKEYETTLNSRHDLSLVKYLSMLLEAERKKLILRRRYLLPSVLTIQILLQVKKPKFNSRLVMQIPV